ncbi:MarR family winged helix-turn-helix transcriptional regulator [Streptococcus anginosus]|uniref:MarR family winged helix-turn-helix transcriptional regulator n=1 Tax=Streptococcus anginosus TaxID=1328 RepID=A0AAP2P0W0_STRAP|nr:MarR family winged helix-turn-helix transcriptional regulator [Streptococcus anginosus]MBZ2155668.1 MarR family winged helix-turn-helix transcriptional regulator [Streptococcus anginosus]
MGNIVLQHENIGIIRTLHNLDKVIFKVINERLGVLNVSHVQALILIFLSEHIGEEIFQKNLEKEFGLSNPTVTASVKSMEVKGLVKKVKSQKDGRYYVLSLENKGMQLAPKCNTIYEEIESQLKELLTNEQLIVLNDIDKKISALLGDI